MSSVFLLTIRDVTGQACPPVVDSSVEEITGFLNLTFTRAHSWGTAFVDLTLSNASFKHACRSSAQRPQNILYHTVKFVNIAIKIFVLIIRNVHQKHRSYIKSISGQMA